MSLISRANGFLWLKEKKTSFFFYKQYRVAFMAIISSHHFEDIDISVFISLSAQSVFYKVLLSISYLFFHDEDFFCLFLYV